MKTVMGACLVGAVLIVWAVAQKPALRQGISVEMPVASHAVEMRAADNPNTAVVAITAGGRVFAGIEPTEPTALSTLTERTVYLKADVRAPYQTVLTVLDALRGRTVVLLSVPPESRLRQGYVSPYGTKLIVSR